MHIYTKKYIKNTLKNTLKKYIKKIQKKLFQFCLPTYYAFSNERDISKLTPDQVKSNIQASLRNIGNLGTEPNNYFKVQRKSVRFFAIFPQKQIYKAVFFAVGCDY